MDFVEFVESIADQDTHPVETVRRREISRIAGRDYFLLRPGFVSRFV